MAEIKGSIKSDRLNTKLSTKRVSVSIGGGGTVVMSDHASLTHLNYLESGHIGFAGIEFGTTAEWAAKFDYVPPKGMLVVYTDYKTVVDPETGETKTYMGIKIGNGNAYLADLAFTDECSNIELQEHIQNTDVHIQNGERDFWNNKINCEDEVEDGLLIITRN